MSGERVYKWDNVKYILIVLVILGHVADNLYSYHWCKTLFLAIYLFHMPAFFFISGLFSKKTVNAERLDLMKIIPLLAVSMLLNFFSFYVKRLSTGGGNYYFILRNNISWYLFAFAVFYVLAWLLRKVKPPYVFFSSLFLVFIAGFDETVGSYLAVARIITFFPMFYLGYCLDEKKVRNFLDRKLIRILSVILLLAYCAFVYLKTDTLARYRGIITGNGNYINVLGNNFMKGLPARAFFYVLMVLVIAALCSIMPSGKLPFVSYAGSNTLPVYFMHLPVLKLMLLYAPFSSLFAQGL